MKTKDMMVQGFVKRQYREFKDMPSMPVALIGLIVSIERIVELCDFGEEFLRFRCWRRRQPRQAVEAAPVASS